MAKKLSSWERERRRAEKERERQKRADFNARQRSKRRREKEQERNQVARERATARTVRRREKEREQDRIQAGRLRQQREKKSRLRSEERQAYGEVNAFKQRLAFVTEMHRHVFRDSWDLDRLEESFNERLEPVPANVKAFQPREWTLHLKEPEFRFPDFRYDSFRRTEYEMLSWAGHSVDGRLLGIGLTVGAFWAYGQFNDVDATAFTYVLVGVAALFIGYISSSFTEALKRTRHDQRESNHDQAHEDAEDRRHAEHQAARQNALSAHEAQEQKQRDTHEAHLLSARQVFATRRAGWEASERLRQECYDDEIAHINRRHDMMERRRIDLLDRARNGHADLRLEVLRTAFPMRIDDHTRTGSFSYDATNAVGRADSGGRWGRLTLDAVTVGVDGNRCAIRLLIPTSGAVPTHIVVQAASGRSTNARKMSAKDTKIAQDQLIASAALTHALHAWRWLPVWESVTVEVVESGIEPSTGHPRLEVRLSACYTREVLADSVIESLDPIAMLERLDHQRRPVAGRQKKTMPDAWVADWPMHAPLPGWTHERDPMITGPAWTPDEIYVRPATANNGYPEPESWSARPSALYVVAEADQPLTLGTEEHQRNATGGKESDPLGHAKEAKGTADSPGGSRVFTSFVEALAASRAGDTIYIEPGHHEVGPKAPTLWHPITIEGTGSDSVLLASKASVVVVRSAVVVRNLFVKSTREDSGPFRVFKVDHDASLRLEDCTIEGHGRQNLVDANRAGASVQLEGCTLRITGDEENAIGVCGHRTGEISLLNTDISGVDNGVWGANVEIEGGSISAVFWGVHGETIRFDPDPAPVILDGVSIEAKHPVQVVDPIVVTRDGVEHTEVSRSQWGEPEGAEPLGLDEPRLWSVETSPIETPRKDLLTALVSHLGGTRERWKTTLGTGGLLSSRVGLGTARIFSEHLELVDADVTLKPT